MVTFREIFKISYCITYVKCSISECRAKGIQKISVGSKETRNLCARHLRIYMSRYQHHKPEYTRASGMR